MLLCKKGLPIHVDMPEMSKILCEMMLCEKDCNEIKEIRKILVDWRNKR
jgi:hypothetical protein